MLEFSYGRMMEIEEILEEDQCKSSSFEVTGEDYILPKSLCDLR